MRWDGHSGVCPQMPPDARVQTWARPTGSAHAHSPGGSWISRNAGSSSIESSMAVATGPMAPLRGRQALAAEGDV